MLNVLSDGPFRYLHSAATGELVLTLVASGGQFTEEDGQLRRTLREWKRIARQRMGDQLITDER
jgi:hypothetical protein